jgi:hypothetical protein
VDGLGVSDKRMPAFRTARIPNLPALTRSGDDDSPRCVDDMPAFSAIQLNRIANNERQINRLIVRSLGGFRRLVVFGFVHKFFVPSPAVPALGVIKIFESSVFGN